MLSYQRCCLFVVLLAAVPLSADWKDEAETRYGEGCYLEARRILQERLVNAPDDALARRGLAKLDRIVSEKRASPALTLAERSYFEAYRAIERGDRAAAIGACRKFLHLQEVQMSPPGHREAEVRRVSERLRKKAAAGISPRRVRRRVPSRSARRRSTPRNDRRSEKAAEVRPERAAWVAQQGETARKNGQIERALHFYRLAQRLDPASEPIAGRLKQLEAELR